MFPQKDRIAVDNISLSRTTAVQLKIMFSFVVILVFMSSVSKDIIIPNYQRLDRDSMDWTKYKCKVVYHCFFVSVNNGKSNIRQKVFQILQRIRQ